MTRTPTLAKRMVAQKLHRLRSNAQITLAEAAVEVGCDPTTISRWEKARTTPRRSDVESLCRLYQAAPAEVSRLTSLLLQSGKRGMWESADLAPELRQLYEAEMTADGIKTIELDLIPGLAQTTSYIRTVQDVQVPQPTERRKAVERVWAQRQRLVFEEPVPHIKLALGQSALRYIESLPSLYNEQITKLLAMEAIPTVQIRVLTTLHAAMTGGFTVIEPHRDHDETATPFVFVESADGFRYIETHDVVSSYQNIFDMVWDRATPLEEFLR